MNGKRPGGWVALAWRYYRDERILEVSADAELLWLHALAFTGEAETDGRVPHGALTMLASKLRGAPEDAARELVDAGLWFETVVGWRFGAAWERWQYTAEESRASRARQADRVRKWRARNASREDATNDARDTDAGVVSGTSYGSTEVPDTQQFEFEGDEPVFRDEPRGDGLYTFVVLPGGRGAPT